jgi:hypothetical protein
VSGQLVVILIRLILPLSILRWPLAGGLVAMLADALDVVLIEIVGGQFDHYAELDKALDTYYLSLELIVSMRWVAIAKWTSVALFAYRLVGVILFEVTQTRVFLVLFPNLFENFYLAYLVIVRAAPRFELTPARLAALLFVLLVPKLAQEYLLHYADAQPWDWTKRHLGGAWPF